MARYPLSVLDGKVSEALEQILRLHLPPGARILDPTYGEGILWSPRLQQEYVVTPLDILPPYQQDLFTLPQDRPELLASFDGIIYDPPYMIGVLKSDDPRAATYGGYAKTEQEFHRYMTAVQNPFPLLLRPGGKLIVKCSDQYIVKERRFRLWHYYWIQTLLQADYSVVDFFIYRYHRTSPTAFQVKDRPASVIVHTYFIVAQTT